MGDPPPAVPTDPLPEPGLAAAQEIGRALARVRHRRWLQAATAMVGWSAMALALGVALLWSLLAAGWRGPMPAWTAAAVTGVALLSAAGATVLRLAWRARDARLSARLLDRALDDDGVRISIELLAEHRSGRLRDPFAVQRLISHLGRTADLVARVDLRRAIPWPRSARVGLLSLPLALITLVATVAPGSRGRLARALERPAAAAVVATVQESTRAESHLRDVQVELTAPAYTGLPAEILPSGSGSFAALPGTRVVVVARVDAPPRSTTFQVGEGPWQPGEVLGDDRIRIEFTVGQERSYRARVETEDDTLDSGALPILLREDAAPHARLAARPEEPLELSGGDELPLALELEDDFGVVGVDRVLFRRGVEIARERVVDLADAPRTAGVEDRWTVPGEESLAGGTVWLHYDVLDNDSVLGPRHGSSEPLRVHVLGAADLRRKAVAAQDELLDALLLALAEHLLWQEGLDHVSERDAIALRARERMVSALEAAARVRDGMQQDPATDGVAFAALGTAMDDATRSWDELAQLLRRADIEGSIPDELAVVLDDHISNLERAALLLDRERTATQRALVADAAQRANAAMEALREAMAGGDEAAIGDAMAELQQRMAELAREMAAVDPGHFAEVMNQAAGSASQGMMSRLQSLMAEGRTDEAMSLLEQSARSMARMQQMGGQGVDAAEVLAELDQALEQVQALAEQQAALNRELGAIEGAFPDAAGPSGLEGIRGDLDELRDAVAGLQREEHGPRLGGVVRGRVGRAGRFLEDADDGLARGDLDQSIRGLARSDDELLDLLDVARMIEEAGATRLPPEEFEAWTEQVAGAEAEHLRLVERVLAAERAWRDARSAAGQSATPLAGRQRELADDTASLGESVGGVDGLSWDGAAQRRRLQDVEQLMRGAADAMQVGRVPRARDSGGQAMAQLDRLRSDLQQTREMIQQSAQGANGAIPMAAISAQGWQRMGRGDGLDPTSGMVELPPPGRFAGPEELREAALEAAAEDAPPEYRPLNDRYYEELVR